MTQAIVSLYSGGEIKGTREVVAAIGQFCAWAEVLERHYAVTSPIFVASVGNEIIGGCYGYFHRGGGSAATLFVPRFAIFAADPEVEKALLLALGQHARARGLKRSVVAYKRANLDGYYRWTKTSVELRLTDNEAAMFSSLRGKSRNTIRRASEIFEVSRGNQYLGAFYEVYLARMREKNLASHSREFFYDLLNVEKGFDLIVARRSGVVVAGMIWRRAGRQAHYLFNAATEDGLRYNANHLLMWETMRVYAEQGIETFDLGESLPDGGVYAFKTVQFGGVPFEVCYADILSVSGSQYDVLRPALYLRLVNRFLRILPSRIAPAILHNYARAYSRLL